MKRPFPVTFLGGLFIVIGVAALAYHLSTSPFDRWMILIAALEILAIVAGVFLLLGRNWARWLMLAWIAFHVYAAALNSWSLAGAHLVLLIAVAYSLLTPPASRYFRSAPSQ